MVNDRAAFGGRERGRLGRRLLVALVSPNSYGLVLVLIVATYVLSVSTTISWMAPLVLLVQVVTVWLALRTSGAHRSVRLTANALLAVAIVVASVDLLTGASGESALVFGVSGLLYLVAPIAIIRHLASRPVVDLESLLGVVSAYLLIGMFFAFTYRFLSIAQTGPFFGTDGDGTTSQALFFSFTTLTTTGYGNLVPDANPGQSLAVGEMLIGQLFLITALGKVVTAWRPSTTSSPPPEEDD